MINPQRHSMHHTEAIRNLRYNPAQLQRLQLDRGLGLTLSTDKTLFIHNRCEPNL